MLLVALGQFIAIPLLRLDILRVRTVLPIAFAVVLYATIGIIRRSPGSERTRLTLYLGFSTGLVLILRVISEPSLYGAGSALIPLLLGWSVPLALLEWKPDLVLRLPAFPKVSIVALLVLGIGLWIAVRPPGHHPVNLDEVLYLLQAQYVRHAPFMRPLDQDLAPFFLIRQSYFLDGYLNGQYPPGWPLVLSLVSGSRATWLLLLAVHLLVLTATYAFGRAVASARVGVFAAILFGVNGFGLRLSTHVVPHVFGAALALLAGALMIRGIQAPPRKCALCWALAGLLLGFACATRPLTGMSLTIALWLWALTLERPNLQTALSATGAACAGGLIPIAWLMHYNSWTTGSPFRFGYDLAQNGLHALGFGMRGFVEYTSAGLPVERVSMFGPLQALINCSANVYSALIDCWPTYLIFPLLYLASRAGVRWRWLPIASFAILPVAYFFYFYNYLSDRFYFELIPFALAGTAVLVGELIQRSRAIGLAMAFLLVTTMLADAGTMALERRREYEMWNVTSEAVERIRANHPELLVFVRVQIPGVRGEPGLGPLYWYNVYEFPSAVIVARDLGPRDTLLARRFPGRYAVLISILPGQSGGASQALEVRPLNLE